MKYGDAVVYGVGADSVFALVIGSRMVAPAEHGVTLVDGEGEPLPAEEHVDLIYLDPSIGEVKYAGDDDYMRRAFGVRAATLTECAIGFKIQPYSAAPVTVEGAPVKSAIDDSPGTTSAADLDAAAEETQDASQSDPQDQACATQQEAPQSSEQ
jgi:hypothetical protein